MREVALDGAPASETLTFRACVATILELSLDAVPEPPGGDDAVGLLLARWLSGLGLGIVPIADVGAFTWAGPWIGRVRPADGGGHRAVVMYGVPSGVAWDPAGVTARDGWALEDGFLLSALDIALARPPRPPAPAATGSVASLWVASTAGAPARSAEALSALAGRGLEGDRHVTGDGTFPSGLPGSALTLIEDEVCASFSPPLEAGEHRRNVVTRGIDLNALVGHEFTIGDLPCRGMRLCEPCRVVDRYAARPVLRALVHRAGLRADILADGEIHVGDEIRVRGPNAAP